MSMLERIQEEANPNNNTTISNTINNQSNTPKKVVGSSGYGQQGVTANSGRKSLQTFEGFLSPKGLLKAKDQATTPSGQGVVAAEDEPQSKGGISGKQEKQQKVNAIYDKLQDRLKLRKKNGELNFQKMMADFKGLDTFVDTKKQIQGMNIVFQKGFKSNLEVLKIRDKIEKLNKELKDTSEKYQSQFLVDMNVHDNELMQQAFKGAKNVKDLLKKSQKAIKNGSKSGNAKLESTAVITDSLKDYMRRLMPFAAPIEAKDDVNDFYNNLEKVFDHQSNMLQLQEYHEELEKRKQVEKEAQLRDLIKQSKYDLNSGANDERNVPNQSYFEEFHKQTQRTINKAIRESKKIYREKLGLISQKQKLFIHIQENIIEKGLGTAAVATNSIHTNDSPVPGQGAGHFDGQFGGQSAQYLHQPHINSPLRPQQHAQLQQQSTAQKHSSRQNSPQKQPNSQNSSFFALSRQSSSHTELPQFGSRQFLPEGSEQLIASSRLITSTHHGRYDDRQTQSQQVVPRIQLMSKTATSHSSVEQFPRRPYDLSKQSVSPLQTRRQMQTDRVLQRNNTNPNRKQVQLAETARQFYSPRSPSFQARLGSPMGAATTEYHEKKSFDTLSEEVKTVVKEMKATPPLKRMQSINNNLMSNQNTASSPSLGGGNLVRWATEKRDAVFVNSQQDSMKNFMHSMKRAEGAYKDEKQDFLAAIADAKNQFKKTSEKYEEPKISSIREVQPNEEHQFKTFLRRVYKPKSMQVNNF